MPNLYRNESSNPKFNAQRNLSGRTHYVDDDTLRFHKSRIISARHTDGGLLFAIVTSDAKDMDNRSRGFRYVIFDLFGHVVDRNPAKVDMEWFTSSARAEKAMWTAINAMDAALITHEGIERQERQHAAEMHLVHRELVRLQADGFLKRGEAVWNFLLAHLIAGPAIGWLVWRFLPRSITGRRQ